MVPKKWKITETHFACILFDKSQLTENPTDRHRQLYVMPPCFFVCFSDDAMTDDDADANDPEFNYISEVEREPVEQEEFRFDRPTKVTSKYLCEQCCHNIKNLFVSYLFSLAFPRPEFVFNLCLISPFNCYFLCHYLCQEN